MHNFNYIMKTEVKAGVLILPLLRSCRGIHWHGTSLKANYIGGHAKKAFIGFIGMIVV